MKKLIIALAVAIVSSTGAYAKNVMLEDKVMSSYNMCYLQASMTVGAMKNSGAKATLVLDSPADEGYIYKVVSKRGVVGFVTCAGKEFKVWAIQ